MPQGSRMRNTKTDYVSCPSCGRTLFSLQEVTDQIRVRTGHLPGVAIAIMGCIVNGPGEMADAGEPCQSLHHMKPHGPLYLSSSSTLNCGPRGCLEILIS